MVSISNIIKALKKKSNTSKNKSALGPVFLTPKEATPETIKKITSSGTTVTVGSGSVNNPKIVSYVPSRGGGGGSSYTQTTTPSQAQYEIEIQRQRELEKQRQEELKRIEDERKRQEAIKRQAAQRALENKKLVQLQREAAAEIERKANERRLSASTVQRELNRLKELQQEKTRGVYVPPVDKSGRSEGFYIQRNAERELENYINRVTENLTRDVQTGRISVNNANKLLEQEYGRKYNQIVNRLSQQYPAPEVDFLLRKEGLFKPKNQSFFDKATEFLEAQVGKSASATQRLEVEQLKNKRELERLLGLVKNQKLSDKEFEEIQKQITGKSRRRMELFLQSFLSAGAQRATEAALGLALLAKVPGLLKTKEGRTVLATQIAGIPKGVVDDFKRIGRLYKTNPEQAAAIVATDILLLGGANKVFKGVGKISKAAANKALNLNPYLLNIERGIVRLKKGLPSGKRISLKVGTIADVKEGLSRQLKREGKSLVAVTAQADNLLRGIKRKAIVRKPFSFDEKKLSKVTRDLLKKFDKGKTTPREVLILNRLIREETKRLGVQQKGVDLLERSMYFDPDRTLRKSRLAAGAERAPEEGTLFDLLTGQATLRNKTPRPAVYVIEEFAEKLPRTKEFIPIIRKLKKAVRAGKDPNLTKGELAKLTRWQVTPSGKLKPVGSTTYQGGLEREVTIAPGEAIKRVKKLGTLKIGNTRVPIYAVKIVKGKLKTVLLKRIERIKSTLEGLKNRLKRTKTNKGKQKILKEIQKKEKELNNLKTKRAGKEVKEFLKDIRSRRRTLRRKKVFPIRRKVTSRIATRRGKVSRKRTTKKRGTTTRTNLRRKRTTPRKIRSGRRLTPRPGRRPRITPRRAPPRRPTPRRRPPVRGRRGTRTRPGPKKKKTLIRKRSSNKDKGKKTSKIRGYNVFIRSGKRLIKANEKPLSKTNALDRRAYVIDHSTAAFAPKIVPVKMVKKLGKITQKEKGARFKIKARSYRIRSGKRLSIGGGIIERKGKPRINTRGEKRGLRAARLIKQLQPKPKKKVTGNQRKELLKRLAKARAVRMRNLKRRNRKR